ncbi:hypothetical protein FBU59_006261 [Linderina macrospora]|uniref:Uncharacterized protein n=1 Tax=Linderina macrospora TaxID=4868 RepID=A0ACC1J0F3_9FUNG|nr:hypothetical protein FBU59_006261 [Linderina macrospora]
MPVHLTVELVLDHGLKACHNNFSFLYFIYGYVLAQDIVAWVLYFRMRSVAKAFNEFKLALSTLLIFTAFIVILFAVMMSQGAVYSWGRILLAFSNTTLLNLYLFLILCPPIYGHMFKREECLRKFMDEMHQDGIIAQQARIGNAHKQLYGVNDGTDSYIRQSENSTSGGSKTPYTRTMVENGAEPAAEFNYMMDMASTTQPSLTMETAVAGGAGRRII